MLDNTIKLYHVSKMPLREAFHQKLLVLSQHFKKYKIVKHQICLQSKVKENKTSSIKKCIKN